MTAKIYQIILGVLVIALAVCYFTRQDVEIQTVTVTETHTVTQIDTVFIEKTVYKQLPIPPPDTVYVEGTQALKYEVAHSDSLIEAIITTWAKGEIIKQDFQYTPKFPKYIIRTDSVFTNTHTTTTRTIYPSGIFIGAETVLVGEQFDFSPKVQWVRKDFAIGYRYGINTNSHNLSLTIRL